MGPAWKRGQDRGHRRIAPIGRAATDVACTPVSFAHPAGLAAGDLAESIRKFAQRSNRVTGLTVAGVTRILGSLPTSEADLHAQTRTHPREPSQCHSSVQLVAEPEAGRVSNRHRGH